MKLRPLLLKSFLHRHDARTKVAFRTKISLLTIRNRPLVSFRFAFHSLSAGTPRPFDSIATIICTVAVCNKSEHTIAMRTIYRSSFFCIIWFAFIGLGLSLKYPVDISIKSVQRAISVQSRVAKWLFTFVSLSETNLYLTENTHVEVQLTTKMNLIDPVL